MPKIVCASCGYESQGNNWYRVIAVDGVGWADADIQLHPDGSISGTVKEQVEDIEWDRTTRSEQDWGCSTCGSEASDLESLVKIAYEDGEVDPKSLVPIPGQMTIDDALAG